MPQARKICREYRGRDDVDLALKSYSAARSLLENSGIKLSGAVTLGRFQNKGTGLIFEGLSSCN
jgi:hypothetical protein